MGVWGNPLSLLACSFFELGEVRLKYRYSWAKYTIITFLFCELDVGCMCNFGLAISAMKKILTLVAAVGIAFWKALRVGHLERACVKGIFFQITQKVLSKFSKAIACICGCRLNPHGK